MTEDISGTSDLIHVHHCLSCGTFLLPEQFSSRDNVTGLFECPVCHFSAALNVRVISRAELEDES